MFTQWITKEAESQNQVNTTVYKHSKHNRSVTSRVISILHKWQLTPIKYYQQIVTYLKHIHKTATTSTMIQVCNHYHEYNDE